MISSIPLSMNPILEESSVPSSASDTRHLALTSIPAAILSFLMRTSLSVAGFLGAVKMYLAGPFGLPETVKGHTEHPLRISTTPPSRPMRLTVSIEHPQTGHVSGKPCCETRYSISTSAAPERSATFLILAAVAFVPRPIRSSSASVYVRSSFWDSMRRRLRRTAETASEISPSVGTGSFMAGASRGCLIILFGRWD